MSQVPSPNTPALMVRKWKSDDVYLALSHSFRRKIIRSLAISTKTALEVNGGSGMRRHTSLKHLTLLRQAKLVVQIQSAKDRRQPVYALAPEVVVCHEENHLAVDFGCCTLRFAK